MTVIAWDGHTLAADRRAQKFSLVYSVTKIFRVGEALAGVCGDAPRGMQLVEWIRAGENPETFPKLDDKERAATIVVIRRDGRIQLFEYDSPHPYTVEEPRYADGSGRDIALTAMVLGKSAREAVEMACRLSSDCGNGVDTLTLDEPPKAFAPPL